MVCHAKQTVKLLCQHSLGSTKIRHGADSEKLKTLSTKFLSASNLEYD
jgi:hypothetical protein